MQPPQIPALYSCSSTIKTLVDNFFNILVIVKMKKINDKNIDDLAHDQGIVAGEVERQKGVNEDDEKLADLQGGQVPASRGQILSP
jgi:hypothetical protein